MTRLLFWVTIGGVGLLVVVLAAYLLTVIALLWSTRRSARQILAALERVAEEARPVGEIVPDVNAALAAARDALGGAARGAMAGPHRTVPPTATPAAGGEGS